MTDATYRLAAYVAVPRLGRRNPVLDKELTRAVLARVHALQRLNARLGLMTLPPAVRRSAPDRGDQGRSAGYRGALLAGHGGPGVVRRRTLAKLADGNRSWPVMRRAVAAIGARTSLVGRAPAADARRILLTPAVPQSRLSVALIRRGAGLAPAPRLAALTGTSGGLPHRVAAIATSHIPVRARHHNAASMSQQASPPGFHRTVRQPPSTAAAGNVYLDKALVGYHLTAAITAEQTRAAGRPNISGSSFNSSMAALRPSGAGR